LRRIDGAPPAETDPHRQLAERGTPVYFEDEDEINLAELWLTVRKYKWTIISFTGLVVGATIIGTLLMRPVYMATASVQIEPDASRILEYQDLGGDVNSANQRNFYTTQYEILKSRTLAASVIDELNLMDNPEINGAMGQRGILAGISQLPGLITGLFRSGEGGVASVEAQQSRAVDRFLGKLTVAPIRDSKLVDVSFESFSPELATLVTNTLVDEYMQANLQRYYNAGDQAREFLGEQLAGMQANLERADQSLQDFARNQGIADLEGRMALANDKLASLEQKLTEVQQQKVELQIKYERIQAGHGHNIPEIVGSQLINTLQQELIMRRAEHSELLGQFKPLYPRVLELSSRIDQLQEQIREQERYIQDSIVSRYESAAAQELALQTAIQQQEGQLLFLNERAVQYNILKREVETNKELYNGLLQRMKEVGVAAGVRENNVAVIDAAQKPLAPFKPSLRFNTLMALVLGCLGGTGLAFFLQFLDNTVRRPEDIESLADLPSLGMVPHATDENGKHARTVDPGELVFYSIKHRHSGVSEAYRSLRTSLTFSSPEGMPKTLLVTSTGPGEGKTTTASNLACVLAQNGKRTLLIDADLRKAQLHKHYGKPQVPGLTQLIARRDYTTNSCLHQTSVENLFLMTSGTIPPNPAELLAPERVTALLDELGGSFDHIIFDSAPVLGLADALVLSRSVEEVMLIVSAGKTTKEALKFTVRRLRQVHAPLVGVVLNNVDLESPDYNYYASGYYYSYAPEQTGDPLEEAAAEGVKPRLGMERQV
jgi:capsular exopolysaccharide synthesis family protein